MVGSRRWPVTQVNLWRMGKILCEEAHDNSQMEEVILKPIAEHKGNCPLQTNSMRQGCWSFHRENLKTPIKSCALWLKGNVPIKIPIAKEVSSLLILLIT